MANQTPNASTARRLRRLGGDRPVFRGREHSRRGGGRPSVARGASGRGVSLGLARATRPGSSRTPHRPGLDVEAALKRVAERRDAADVIPIGSRRTARRTAAAASCRRVAGAGSPLPAAAAAVLLVGGRTVVALDAGRRVYDSIGAAQTFATTVGKRDSVRLADGTRVVLAPESQLTVAAGYGNTVREVELTRRSVFRRATRRRASVRRARRRRRDPRSRHDVHRSRDRRTRACVSP